MRILAVQTSPYTLFANKPSNPTFEAGGKPITLQYAVEKRARLIPERVLNEAKEILMNPGAKVPSLMELHKSIYAPLLECKSLDEAKALYEEFSQMKEEVIFERNTRYAKEFKKKTDKNFALKVLQEYWGNLKTKDEIAQSFGMPNRNSLGWPLEQIRFVGYHPNYKTLLKASDEEGNRVIAEKMTAWNTLHPDLMRAKNKHAAQGCKTEEYRKAQAQRMYKYDKEHPERREKISESSKASWAECPEIKQAMAEFALTCPVFIRRIVLKRCKGQKLTENEIRTSKSFFKKFWEAHPELKEVFAQARQKASSKKTD